MRVASRLKPFMVIILIFLAVGMAGCAVSHTASVSMDSGVSQVQQEVELGAKKDQPNQEWPGPHAQSSATQNGITISVTAGIDNLTKMGEWFPVTVIIENSGEPVKGHVIVGPLAVDNQGATYRQEADLGHGAKKRLLFILSNQFGNAPIEAAFISKNKTLVKVVSRHTQLTPEDKLIIAITDDNANRQFFKDITADRPAIKVSYMDQHDLPFRDNALAPASFVVISGASTGSLTKDQQGALSNWVASGGHLIVCGGPGWNKSIAGLPKELLPVQSSGIKTLSSVGPIDDFLGVAAGTLPASPIPVTSASKIQGKVIAGDKSDPLVVTRDFGLGKVTWIALDLTMEPFTSWRVNPTFWNRITQTQPI
ncbi:MAG TPA: hypothetical protein VE439_09950, partial [Anaerolineae bacterium]|nr:hypothetical protein [Anaerolineae bacterium]